MIRYTRVHTNDKKKTLYQYQQLSDHVLITLGYFYNNLFQVLSQLLFANLKTVVKS